MTAERAELGTNLASIIEGHPDDAPALISRGRVTTYGELRGQAAGIRRGLRSLGIQPGDRVAIVAANSAFVPAVYLAIVGIGAVAVLLNPTSPAAELEHQVATVRPKAVVVGAGARTAMTGVDLEALGVTVTIVPEGVAMDGGVSLEAMT